MNKYPSPRDPDEDGEEEIGFTLYQSGLGSMAIYSYI